MIESIRTTAPLLKLQRRKVWPQPHRMPREVLVPSMDRQEALRLHCLLKADQLLLTKRRRTGLSTSTISRFRHPLPHRASMAGRKQPMESPILTANDKQALPSCTFLRPPQASTPPLHRSKATVQHLAILAYTSQMTQVLDTAIICESILPARAAAAIAKGHLVLLLRPVQPSRLA